ncbi:DUF1349 domain-containing protein [Glycomyces sp. NRRL B-16210]|uniref:DUF1349 domain-containing protein n=1 Tax=Glycomyces sp. NRRL B-16210 TaxID=1463821 RepID=UPI0004C1FE22|nr:DUF1349 domain-containing protein [Glycomyces sp. NRRL B-16210]
MTVNLSSLPFALDWDGGVEPPVWSAAENGLEATAAPRTDWYAYAGLPAHAPSDAVKLLGTPPDGDWRFSARFKVGFKSTYDAGALLLVIDDDHWAKFAFEYSPEGTGMIVSVVTRGVSDDANGWTVEGEHVWLRASRIGPAFALHASDDGERWEFVRCFGFGVEGPVRAGLSVQSPIGEGCEAVIDEVAFTTETLRDLRDGS